MSTQPTLRETFLFFAFIILANTALVWATAQGIVPRGAYNMGRFYLLGFVLVATVIAFRGIGAVVGLLKPLTVWRIHPGWYVFATLWAAAVSALVLFGKSFWVPDVFELSDWILRNQRSWPSLIIASLIGEIVWVSYAIRSLSRRFGILGASTLTGVAWAAWWTPITLFNVGVVPDLPIAILFLNMIGVAIMCGFVYGHTQSGIAVLVLQVAGNASALIFPVMAASGGIPTYFTLCVVYLALSLLLFVLFPPGKNREEVLA